jgi:hypothetical protein
MASAPSDTLAVRVTASEVPSKVFTAPSAPVATKSLLSSGTKSTPCGFANPVSVWATRPAFRSTTSIVFFVSAAKKARWPFTSIEKWSIRPSISGRGMVCTSCNGSPFLALAASASVQVAANSPTRDNTARGPRRCGSHLSRARRIRGVRGSRRVSG